MAQLRYGKNTVVSLLKSHQNLEKLYVVEGFKDQKILDLMKENNIKYQVLSFEEMKKLTKNQNAQGIACLVEDYSYTSLEELIRQAKMASYPLLVLLDGIEDPQNLGAILRSCDALGAQGIVISKHNQVGVNSTVAKVSTGAIDYVPVCQVNNLNTAIATLKKEGFWVVASDGTAKMDYRDVDYKCPIVLVVGSEGFGASQLVLKNSDFIVKIPMVGHVNSLNASVATALLINQVYNSRYPLIKNGQKK